jgi:oligoendopeptidase F
MPRPVFDAEAPAAAPDLGDLPEWDLTDLYTSEDSPELYRVLASVATAGAEFAERYEGKLAGLDSAGMLACVQAYEKIDRVAGRVVAYAGLRHAQNATDSARAKFLTDCNDRITAATAPLVFVPLEINRIEDGRLAALLAENPELARYRPVFDRLRAMKPYQLSDELERFLHDTSVVGMTAWNSLFDETLAALEFDVDGKKMGLEATLNLLTEQARPRREAGARAVAAVLSGSVKTFSRVHNTLIKEKEITDRWRKLPTPQMSRHLANDVEPEVVEALRDAVVAAYPRLSHRYYELKRGWLGLDRMQVWDRNAPLPMEETRIIGWDTARKTVLDAYAKFSPQMADVGERFFQRRWFDAGVRPGKSTGAFDHTSVSDVVASCMLI